MDTHEHALPFRWNIQQRANLGSLLDGPREALPEAPLYELTEGPPYYPPDALTEITTECARILALCDNADLCFVGRSLESLFDYLSGLLFETSWAERLWLLQFSWYGRLPITTNELAGLRYYFEHLGLDPLHLPHRKHAVAFVDIVSSGGTFGNLVAFLHQWTRDGGGNCHAMQQKIRFIGITRRTRTSPRTWRWQQHVAWKDLLPPRALKSVPMPEGLWEYFGGRQKKTTKSYTHWRWGSDIAARPDYAEEHLQALRLAVQCFDWGRDKTWRQQFAHDLSNERAMMYPWFRALVGELT